MRKVTVVLLAGLICLLATTSVLAAKYNEAPMLKVRVAAGELPPVEERLPEEPYVVEPFEEIGRYGGTLYGFALNETCWNDFLNFDYDYPSLGSPMEIAPDGKWFAPHLLRDYEWSDDYKILTMYLRKGAKWSDGEPFVADDFTFYWNDCKAQNSEELRELLPLTPIPFGMEKCEKIDDYTVRFHFAEPSPISVAEYLHGGWSMWGTYVPFHYLKKWHIKYNPKADELAEEEGFENWWKALHWHGLTHAQQNDIGLPRMGAWVLVEKRSNMWIMERNPYYFAVDTAGNQLPYIDREIVEIVNREVYKLRVLNGEADMGRFGVSLPDYPLFKANEEEGNYQVLFKPGAALQDSLYFNWFDPDLVLRELWRDVRFRQAMSLGIDRQEINETIYFGKGQIRPVITSEPDLPFYKKEWDDYYTQHDPEKANALLDEIGLEWDKNHEWRLRPDGEPLILVTEYADETADTSVMELLRKNYKTIGINLFLKKEDIALYRQRCWDTAIHSVAVTKMGSAALDSWAGSNIFYPSGTAYIWAKPWGVWFLSEGQEGEEPPEDLREQYARVLKLRTIDFASEEGQMLLREINQYAMEQLWFIGTVDRIPGIITFKNTLGNVIDPMRASEIEMESGRQYLGGPNFNSSAYADQLFFKE